MITGESGSGKTQATKVVIKDLGEFGVPSLILDFKDDYSAPPFSLAEQIFVHDPYENPSPIQSPSACHRSRSAARQTLFITSTN